MRDQSSLPLPGTGVPQEAVVSSERLLDMAVEMSFPASDPISIDHAFREADRREHLEAFGRWAVPDAGAQSRRPAPVR